MLTDLFWGNEIMTLSLSLIPPSITDLYVTPASFLFCSVHALIKSATQPKIAPISGGDRRWQRRWPMHHAVYKRLLPTIASGPHAHSRPFIRMRRPSLIECCSWCLRGNRQYAVLFTSNSRQLRFRLLESQRLPVRTSGRPSGWRRRRCRRLSQSIEARRSRPTVAYSGFPGGRQLQLNYAGGFTATVAGNG